MLNLYTQSIQPQMMVIFTSVIFQSTMSNRHAPSKKLRMVALALIDIAINVSYLTIPPI